jgi:hypothetical protein
VRASEQCKSAGYLGLNLAGLETKIAWRPSNFDSFLHHTYVLAGYHTSSHSSVAFISPLPLRLPQSSSIPPKKRWR